MTREEETLIAFDTMVTAIAKYDIHVITPELRASYMARIERAGFEPKTLESVKQLLKSIEEEGF